MSKYLRELTRYLTDRRPRIEAKSGKRHWFRHWAPHFVGSGSANTLSTAKFKIYYPRRSFFRFWLWILALVVISWEAVHELNTSNLQARILTYYSGKLVYALKPGPASRIVYPRYGPFDERRGYTKLPEFVNRLTSRGFRVSEQAEFAPALARAARWGIPPPYRESDDIGLMIRSADGAPIFDATAVKRLFPDYESIPPLLVNSILFMENRDLGEESNEPENNPVIDWPRLGKAAVTYLGRKLKLPMKLEGGSTLATQLEKFRHSPAGRTDSGVEKLKQMLSASLKVYKRGRDTREARQEIIVDYLNSVPLAAVPGFGEVNGLGNGLFAWFGVELGDICQELRQPSSAAAQARAYKYVLTLLSAIRGPGYYLGQHRDELEARMRYFSALLTKQGIISPALAENLKQIDEPMAQRPKESLDDYSPQRKAGSSLRIHLANLLGIPRFYDLAQLHLEADATLNLAVQNEVLNLLNQLQDKNYLSSHGLYGDRLLSPGADPKKITYSFMLFESRPEGNLLRAQADNLDTPLDMNEGVKLQLGSTAKLRVLSHYLGLMFGLHRQFSGQTDHALAEQANGARDPLTRWAIESLRQNPRWSAESFLAQSLERKYSASPYETFFTGGGAHTFKNFNSDDNAHYLTIREATQRSTNLVFIRLMRDIVRYHQAHLPYDTEEVLSHVDNPVRIRLLHEIAGEDARDRLADFYQTYRGMSAEDAIKLLLGKKAKDPRYLTILFFAWYPEARTRNPEARLAQWLQARGLQTAPDQVTRLIRAFGNPRLTIADYGYLVNHHPLEVWTVGELIHNPAISRNDLLVRSNEASRIASAWLFQSRNRGAQNLRLSIRFEQDAFERMTPDWRRLGFPFEYLVPSFATAIGSSSDRPAALADLMGIILNHGMRRSTVRFQTIRFAGGTPYETAFVRTPAVEEKVMEKPVASLLRKVLSEVVEKGTAIRAAHAFTEADGNAVPMGGKTGSGDNRFVTVGRDGVKIGSQAVNRTATFVFYLGDRYFGVITTIVDGRAAADYKFTSALPLSVLKLLAPRIQPYLFPDAGAIQTAPAGTH